MVDMKILIVVNNFVPEIGSAAHIYFDLAKAFVKRGHEIDVITSYPRKFNLAKLDQERKFPLEEEMDEFLENELEIEPELLDQGIINQFD